MTYAHVAAIYARHICSNPEHLEHDYPLGLRKTPLAIGQKCILTIGISGLSEVLVCKHVGKYAITVQVHCLDAEGEVMHIDLAASCIDIVDSYDMTREEGLAYLRSKELVH